MVTAGILVGTLFFQVGTSCYATFSIVDNLLRTDVLPHLPPCPLIYPIAQAPNFKCVWALWPLFFYSGIAGIVSMLPLPACHFCLRPPVDVCGSAPLTFLFAHSGACICIMQHMLAPDRVCLCRQTVSTARMLSCLLLSLRNLGRAAPNARSVLSTGCRTFLKQRALNFFPPSAYAASVVAQEIPATVVFSVVGCGLGPGPVVLVSLCGGEQLE